MSKGLFNLERLADFDNVNNLYVYNVSITSN